MKFFFKKFWNLGFLKNCSTSSLQLPQVYDVKSRRTFLFSALAAAIA